MFTDLITVLEMLSITSIRFQDRLTKTLREIIRESLPETGVVCFGFTMVLIPKCYFHPKYTSGSIDNVIFKEASG